MAIENVLYRANATATGGREGRAVSSDSALDVKLTTPKELGGNGLAGTNPEQLFAAGYSACFLGAMKFVANRDKLKISPDVAVEGTVGIGRHADEAQTLIDRAHIVCPYSNATRGNIDVTLQLV
jgi:osmotically inducible protein OsmC